MPAAAPRPTNGASANASDPATSARGHSQSGKPDCGAGPGSRRRAASANVAAATMATNDETTIASVERDDVAGQLLEGDPPARQRRGRDELHAAAARFGGERPGQGEDRPQARDEREERAVLVLDVAAERLDVDRPAGEALQDRRNGGRSGLPISLRATRAWRTRTTIAWRRRSAGAPMDGADRDRGAARIADGLAEDAAEAEDPAPQRGTARGAAGVGCRSCGHRVMPPRPACSTGRTRRGTSPRGTARGSTKSRPRGARRRARPG